ncbi:MAG: hydrolase 2, exosortase A system-associated [Alphaproteobacteria bacterium]|nr:MAG: hydrolase 2, exosortase A system-associated [Alphaproteobacteria bacterium]
MSPSGPRPLFLDGPAGPVFAIYHPPDPQAPHDAGDIVYVPPFAEEMNQSRRMAALQARHLAAAGTGVLLLDLFGTGDSGGDFATARWETWLGDIAAAMDWITAAGRPLAGLWGLRLGAALALEAARTRAGGVPRLLLWQPVTRGRTFLTQFLRLRIAAALGGEEDGANRESTESLRRRLAAGEAIEVAGYSLAPALAAAIEALDLSALVPPPGTRVGWIEIGAGAGAEPAQAAPSPAAARVIAAWQETRPEDHAPVAVRAVPGEPFWAIQSWLEPVLVPALWPVSVDLWQELGS